jgi:hypothetical protein
MLPAFFRKVFFMGTKSRLIACGLLTIGLFVLAGCGKGKTNTPGAGKAGAAHPHHHDHGHAHGPNGGHIIGLDTEKYHGELTHDAASHRVGIFFLGEDAATAAPIDAASVTIDVSADGKSTTYMLPAVAQPGETAGKSSYFELVSEPLETILFGQTQAPSSEVELTVTIEGKPQRGLIDTRQMQEQAAGHSHSDADGDILVWHKEVSEQGYTIALGHHGVMLLAGSKVEPAVQITREGQPVADAKVFNGLLDADGNTVLAEEAATVYEPATTEEPSHYAQGALKIPPGTRDVTLRFRIVLPEGKGEHTYDVPVAVK